jgi:hypothetical protein
MENKVQNIIKKLGIGTFIAMAILLVTIVSYLIVSLITEAWATSWLIVVGGTFLAIIIFSAFTISKFLKEKKILVPRLLIGLCIILLFVFVFLLITILTDMTDCWILFLIMGIALIGADTVVAYWIDCKGKLINLLAFIQISLVLEYVVLALVQLFPWNPYWLLPVGGAVIDGVIVIITLVSGAKEKKSKKEIEDKVE